MCNLPPFVKRYLPFWLVGYQLHFRPPEGNLTLSFSVLYVEWALLDSNQ